MCGFLVVWENVLALAEVNLPLAMKLRARMADRYDVDYGYLEFANPVINKGLDGLKARGAEEVLAVP